MDAFVNAVPPPVKQEVKHIDYKEATIARDSNKDSAIKEITKDIKEKDNYESKKDLRTSVPQQNERLTPVSSEAPSAQVPLETVAAASSLTTTPAQNNKVTEAALSNDESSTGSLDSATNSTTTPLQNDVVDHAIAKEDVDIDAIVAQKNEENSKYSRLCAGEETPSVVASSVIDKQNETESSNQNDVSATTNSTAVNPPAPSLKYSYESENWSPINQLGKKVYGRELLMALQEDPQSKIKPPNLPDMDVVLNAGSWNFKVNIANKVHCFCANCHICCC